MGYGAISGVPIVARSANNVVTAQPRTQLTSHTGSHVVQVENISERTPLIVQRRRIRRRQQEGILNWKIAGLFLILMIGVFIGIHLLVIEYGEWPANYPFHLIDLKLDDQLDKLNLSPLNSSQVSNVVLLHTRGDYCYNYSTCMSIIRGKQININQTNLHPYNFLIGGDGKTYEMRGWNYKSGFEGLPFNDQAVTVGLIGDFSHIEPATNQVQEVDAFISDSIKRRKLLKNYKIHVARLPEKPRDGHKMIDTFKQKKQWAGWI